MCVCYALNNCAVRNQQLCRTSSTPALYVVNTCAVGQGRLDFEVAQLKGFIVDGAGTAGLNVAAVVVAALHELSLVEVSEVEFASSQVGRCTRRVVVAIIPSWNNTNTLMQTIIKNRNNDIEVINNYI